MIKAMRSLRHLCSSTFSAHYFMSFQNKRELMIQKQFLKAFWAKKIIIQIGKQIYQPLLVSDKTFRQYITNLQIKETQRHYKIYRELLNQIWVYEKNSTKVSESQTENKIKEEVFEALKTGVTLNKTVYNQERFMNASLKNVLIFWPNILVSRRIFYKLYFFDSSQLIISGPYGISKSISLMFYIHFSNFLTRYYYQLGQQTNQRFKQKMKNLNQEFQLQAGTFKYWYWSIDKNKIQLNQKIDLKQIILNQANQLPEQVRKKLQNLQFDEFIKQLRAQYAKHGINTFISVIDQINVAASYMRKWNEFVRENREDLSMLEQQQNGDLKGILNLAQKRQLQTNIDLNMKNKATGIYLKELLHDFIKLNQNFSGWILNSSANMEQDLIQDKQFRTRKSSDQTKINKAKKLKYQQISLDLQNHTHSSPQFYHIDYHSQLNKPSGKTDFWHFFWCNIDYALRQNFTKEQRKQFKKQYLLLVSQQQAKSYYRFLHIREYLTQLQLSRYPLIQTINNLIDKLVQGFQQFCIKQYQKKVENFISEKGTHQQRAAKSRFMYILMMIAEDKVEQKKGQQQITASYVALDRCIGSISLNQYIFSNNHNKDFLPISKDIQSNIESIAFDGILKFPWKAQDFIKIMSSTFYRGNRKYEGWKQYLQEIQPYQGAHIEGIIHKVLYPKSKVQFEFHTKKVEDKDRLRIFEINHFTPFKFYAKKASVNFKKQFSQMFEKAKINRQEWVLGRPKDQKNKFNSQNVTLDFVLIKCQKIEIVDNQQTLQYTLYLFDVATGSNLGGKKTDAIEYYKIIKDQLKNQQSKDRFIFKHVFLCYQSQCKYSQEDLNGFIMFEYTSLEKMMVKKTQNNYSLATLQDIINFKHLNGVYKYYKQLTIQQQQKKIKQKQQRQKKQKPLSIIQDSGKSN